MPPEQARGQRVDERADVFAIGAMLWELCSLVRVPPDDLRQRRRMLQRVRIDSDLAAIIDKALANDPAKRYPMRARSLRITPATEALTHELFAETPRTGETVDVDLASGLSAHVPIALYSKSGRTLGDDPSRARATQSRRAPPSTGFDRIASAADVIVQWNVLAHFWPYWSDVATPWLPQLDRALGDALSERNVDEHVVTLRRLSVAAPDGHSSVGCPEESQPWYPPFNADWVDDEIVITHSATPDLLPGDVIVGIDGQPIAQRFAAEQALVSGSPQWRRTIAVLHLGRGTTAGLIELQVRRDGRALAVRTPRVDHQIDDVNSHPAIERLPDGVYYIDLDRTDRADLTAIMDRLAEAPGVVFDLRIGPNDHEWLSHLLVQPDTADRWLAIPLIIRPDHPSAPAAWQTSGWRLPVSSPHLRGRIAFLSGPRARSYPESVLALVEHYHLGAIVGSPSAGANGDVAVISEPSGCTMRLTGRRVTKLDGSRHYLLGTQPTIPAARTFAGVAAGRDEVLERALAYVRTGR